MAVHQKTRKKVIFAFGKANNLDRGPPDNISCQISKLYLSLIQKPFVLVSVLIYACDENQ
jgi:hypothetical protein